MNYHEVWTAMNDLEQSFCKISTIEFLTEQLQSAVENNDQRAITEISNALIAYIPIFAKNFDEKFQVAWKATVTPVFMSVKENNNTVEKYDEVCKYFDSKC